MSRDWSRVEAELETVVAGSRNEAGKERREPGAKNRSASKPDTDAVLKQIAEALRSDD